MNDASSHVATGHVMTELASGDAFLAEYYRFDAIAVPYWSTTLVLAALNPIAGPSWGFRLLLLLYVVGLPLAFWLLLRRDAPDNLPLFGVAGFAVFNWAYYLGEAPFFCGMPLALLGYWLFRKLDGPAVKKHLALFLAVALVTGFTHVFALVGLIAACGMDANRRFFKISAAQWIAGVASVALLGWLAYSIFGGHDSDANSGRWVFSLAPYRLAQVVTHPMRSPSRVPHNPSLIFGLALGALLVVPHLRKGLRASWDSLRAQLNPVFLWPALGCLLLAYPGPMGVEEPYGFEDIGERFTLLALLFSLGSIRLSPLPRVRYAVLAVLVGFGGVKAWDTWRVHRDYQAPVAELDDLLAQIPEHQRVLPLLDEDDWSEFELLYHRYGNWAVIDRAAYGPHVFARTGQQPLVHLQRSEHRRVADREVTAAEWDFYDYVLVQSRRETPSIVGLTEHTERVAEAGLFRLYRVRTPPGEDVP